MNSMNIFARFLFATITVGFSLSLSATPATDYATLTRDVRQIPMSGTAGGLAVIGRLAIPVAISTEQTAPIAAGYFGDQPKGGRMVGFAHTSLSDPSHPDRRQFLRNVVKWAGRSPDPKLACGPGVRHQPWKQLGVNASAISTPPPADALARFDVIILSLHDNQLPGSVAALRTFARSGKGILFTGTPWAAKKEVLEAVNQFIQEAGLSFHGDYTSDKSFSIPSRLTSPYRSALIGIDALTEEKAGRQELAASSLKIASRAVAEGLAVRPAALGLASRVASLSDAAGWIQPTKAKPLIKDRSPVEAMLARYQADQLDSLPADKLPAHPSAADWPGGVPADSPTITRQLRLLANAPSDKLINSGRRGVRINTGLYAIPGRPITVTLPESAIEARLVVQIGVHVDRTFHLPKWHRFPQLSREWKLNQATIQAGCAFGGLVIIGVPPGCNLGRTEVRISGAVQAPAFVLGESSPAEWNSTLKHAPGAWGYIQSSDFCSYLPRSVLRQIDDPERIAKYWQTVITTADQHLGYGDWRKRGEGAYTDRDISAGYGHAGYPVVMAYGDRDRLAKRGPDDGDWGFLHEIGHTFQDSFDGNYTIATHAEVDVNLVPGIIKMLVHDVTCIDNRSHNTFDAKPRLAAVKLFQAAPPAQQTWDRACKTPAAYDFYFTLAECFGWDLYGRALGRLMNFLKHPEHEPELNALDQKSPNHKRDRFFLLFCQESGHNLLPHFQKYGLGKGNFGLSPTVLAKVKALPEWSGNRPLKIDPPPASINLSAGGGTSGSVYKFSATDPDPGTIFTWSITAGNPEGAYRIDKRNGELTIANSAAIRKPHPLTIKVSDSTVPESTATVTVMLR